jgi:hypothetical protein
VISDILTMVHNSLTFLEQSFSIDTCKYQQRKRKGGYG